MYDVRGAMYEVRGARYEVRGTKEEGKRTTKLSSQEAGLNAFSKRSVCNRQWIF